MLFLNDFRFVIVDTDETFVLKIQDKLEEKISNDTEIIIVTDMQFLKELFSVPQKIDAMLIRKDLYYQDLEKHNSDSICIVTDSLEECNAHADGYKKFIYRYSPISEFVSKLTKELRFDDADEKNDNDLCRVISVVSPCGGAGKTVFSLALCNALLNIGKKVLYIDASNAQSSSYWLNQSVKKVDDMNLLDDLLDCTIDNVISSNGFDYVKPFNVLLTSLGITSSAYLSVIESVKNGQNYDCIVIDTDFSAETTSVLANSTDVFVLALQDAFSIEKLRKFMKSVDCMNFDKYKFVCNQYKDDKKDFFKDLKDIGEMRYIVPFVNVSDKSDLKAIADMTCFKRIATLFG